MTDAGAPTGGHGQQRRDAPPRPLRYLVLWPTAACDMGCHYCYRRDRRGGRMSIEVADAALDLLCESARASGRPAHVQLAGGEPTLVPELIEHVGRRISHMHGVRITCGIQTNATRLTPELIQALEELRIQVGVSLDGPPAVQQAARGRAEATFAGLALLSRRHMPVRVTTVLTALNATHLPELALTLALYPNVTGFGLDPLVPLGSAMHSPGLVPSTEDVRTGVTGLYTTLATVNRTRRKPLLWRELETVRRALARSAAGSPLVSADGRTAIPLDVGSAHPYCFAECGQSMAVAPDGAIYPCSQAVGDPASRAGSVDAVDWRRLAARFAGARLTGPCESCTLHGRCPGDCPSRVEAWRRMGPDGPASPVTCLIYDTLARQELCT